MNKNENNDSDDPDPSIIPKKDQCAGFWSFIEKFPDEQTCVDLFIKSRWGDKVTCIFCNHDVVYRIEKNKRFKCGKCKKSFSPTAKSVFANLKIPLRKCLLAMHILCKCPNGYSSVQLGKDLDISQRSAFYLEMKIRAYISSLKNNAPLTGIVEMDEAYMGRRDPKIKGEIKKTKSRTSMQGMVGMIERGEGGRTIVVPCTANPKAKDLLEIAQKYIDPSAKLMTDSSPIYYIFDKHFDRESVNHSLYEYVRGDVHTNTIEGFWSFCKRGILVTHHSVSKKYLDLYADEYALRRSNCHQTVEFKFNKLLDNVASFRITRKELKEREPLVYGKEISPEELAKKLAIQGRRRARQLRRHRERLNKINEKRNQPKKRKRK